MEKITVYSKPNCVQCTATKRKLDQLGHAYQVVDVTEDQEAYDRIIGLGYQQVPVVEVGSRHWSGYNPIELATL